MRVRMKRARRLPESTDLPIAEVARASGFSDHRRMSLLFRKRVGIVPRNYRRQHRL